LPRVPHGARGAGLRRDAGGLVGRHTRQRDAVRLRALLQRARRHHRFGLRRTGTRCGLPLVGTQPLGHDPGPRVHRHLRPGRGISRTATEPGGALCPEPLESQPATQEPGMPMLTPRRFSATATLAIVTLLAALPGASRSEPPAAATNPAADGQIAETKGGFFSAFSQGFKEDFDREVVRGHFDIGSASNMRRYYCLFDPKKGRSTPNAVSGELVARRDGSTGIKGAAVTPLSCADAEQKGFLVTTGYAVKGAAAAAPAAMAAPAPAAAAVAAAAAPAPVPAPAPAAPVAPVAAAAPSASTRSEVMAVFTSFIAAQNAHDRGATGAVLLDSGDFVWAQYSGK